ncbi:response regulator transcription factor [Thermodesulfovibrio hydrogeniphilus]
MKVLIIEDDKALGESIVEYLQLQQIDVLWLYDERRLPNVLNVSEFDVIIVDLILSYSKGENLITYIRQRGIKTPILVLTAKSSIDDKEECFLRGADDYLTKPFEPKELLLRLLALSRRKTLDTIIEIGDVKINFDAKTVHKSGHEIKISKTAWQLLELFVKNRGRIVSHDTILNYVWGGKVVGDDVIRTYIKELRKILPKDAIQNFKGRGYRLS